MYKYKMVIIFIFFLISCKKNEDEKTIKLKNNQINNISVSNQDVEVVNIDTVIKQNTEKFNTKIYTVKKTQDNSVDANLLKINKNCDSIIYFPKTYKNPAKGILKYLKTKNLKKLSQYFSEFYVSKSDYVSKEDMFLDWKAKDPKSTFWVYYTRYCTMDGIYINDSTFVTPVYSFIKERCLEGKLITVKSSYIYEKPSFKSKKIHKINKNKILEHNYDKIIYPNSKYIKNNFEVIREFDKDIWYYIEEYDGYINNDNVYENLSTIYFVLRKGKWIFYNITADE